MSSILSGQPSSLAQTGQQDTHAIPNEAELAAAPTCLVLTEDVQRIFEKGDPLIVGTSMLDIQVFFQKVIAEAQAGIEGINSRMEPATSRKTANRNATADAPSVSTLQLITQSERYPVPRLPPKVQIQKKSGTKRRSAGSDDELIFERQETYNEAEERSEIPMDAIRLYLMEKTYYPGWGNNAKRNLRKRCEDFAVDGSGMLFYKNKNGSLAECVEDRAERMRLIWECHSVDHRRRDKLFQALKEKYYWKGMLNDITRVLDSCEVCSRNRSQREAQIAMAQLVALTNRGARTSMDSQKTSKKRKTQDEKDEEEDDDDQEDSLPAELIAGENGDVMSVTESNDQNTEDFLDSSTGLPS